MLTGWRVRPFEPRDWASLQRLHDQRGFKFDVPSSLAEALIVENESEEVVQVFGTKETREAIVWVDQNWATPGMRFAAFKDGEKLLHQAVKQKGVEEVFVFVEPSLMPAFGRRLEKLSWVGCNRPCYVKVL